MKRLLLGFALAVALVSGSYAGLVDFINGVKIGASMPENGLQFLGVAPELAGHVQLVDFWATWCEECRESIPKLNALHDKFANKGLVIVGVSQETKEELAPFLIRLPMHYPTAVEGNRSLHKALGIRGIPYAMFVDRSSRIVWRGQPSEITDDLVLSLLAK
jgi:thiol-disulfide isomerase/thioredoxin